VEVVAVNALPRPVTVRNGRIWARSTFAHHLIVRAAATSTGSPTRVKLRETATLTTVSTTANSAQPATWYASKYQLLAPSVRDRARLTPDAGTAETGLRLALA
jgi:hypothetical protein